MPGMDRDIALEALSALTNSTIKPLTKGDDSISVADLLTIGNFLNSVLLKPTEISLSLLAKTLSSLNLTDKTKSNSDEAEGDSEISSLRNELFVDIENFFDPEYDYDFQNFTDDSQLERGGEPYKRPCGWYRFALKVLDKYPDGNGWLGSVPWRDHSEAGEWPVSFHGTSIEGAKGIASSHYKVGPHNAYGRGIYSTPDITVAESYAMSKTFTSKKNGKTYKVIMQNRINPQKRQIIKVKKNYWLIPVPEGSTHEQEKEIVESSIRPYGILIKEA